MSLGFVGREIKGEMLESLDRERDMLGFFEREKGERDAGLL